MTTYQELQEGLFNTIEENAKHGKQLSTIVPTVRDYRQDKRLCLTGVSFLPSELQRKIETDILNPLLKIDPVQYYYPPQALHLTIQNVRASNYPPTFNQNDIKKVKAVFMEVIPNHKRIKFELKGIFNLPTSLAIRAYSNSSLKNLVLELRKKLATAGVADDKVYASAEVFFGNITFCRFTKTPNKEFQQKISNLKNIKIGTMIVNTVSLITTNPGCHPNRTIAIDKIYLS